MANVDLFGRVAILTIGTLEIRNNRIGFSVEASIKPQPNKATIQVYNLNPDHRSQIEQLGSVPVRLDVGYEGGTQTIFLGDLRTCPTVKDGPDLITVVESGDGERAVQTARVSVSVAKGTPVDQVLRDVALALGVTDDTTTTRAKQKAADAAKKKALLALTPGASLDEINAVSTGVQKGNLDQAVDKLKSLGVGIFPAGTVLTGSAAREMSSICKSLNLEWSIQKGKLVILERGRALEGEAVALSKYTGMIGSPTVDNKGILSVSSLMNPEIFPGRLLVLDGDRLQGQYRIEDCTYVGDTRTNDWRIDMHGKRY